MSAKLVRVVRTLLLGGFLSLNCGGGTPPPAPSPSPVPVPPGSPSLPLPDLNGTWSGTLESSGFPTRTISARLIQQADCVDGSWNTVPGPELRWVGAISAFARPASLDGFMSFEFPVGSRLCSGVGDLIGPVTDDTANLTLTITSYNTETCTSGVPNRMIVTLRRDR